jgi:hypothetical protein
MWQIVATEMEIPWRSAESMHWQLGEQGMSVRGNVLQGPPQLCPTLSHLQHAAEGGCLASPPLETYSMIKVDDETQGFVEPEELE